MTPIEARARLCETCATVVHDVAAMDVASVRRLLATGPACVRYLHDAHGNVIFGRVPDGAQLVPAGALLSRVARNRWLASAALFGTALLFEACGPAPRRSPSPAADDVHVTDELDARVKAAADAVITTCRTATSADEVLPLLVHTDEGEPEDRVKAICGQMPVGEYTLEVRHLGQDRYVVDMSTSELATSLTFFDVDGELLLGGVSVR